MAHWCSPGETRAFDQGMRDYESKVSYPGWLPWIARKCDMRAYRQGYLYAEALAQGRCKAVSNTL